MKKAVRNPRYLQLSSSADKPIILDHKNDIITLRFLHICRQIYTKHLKRLTCISINYIFR